MAIQAKYVHTNLIARDWRALAQFYTQVFGCTPVPPERNLSGEVLERGTGVPGALGEAIQEVVKSSLEAAVFQNHSFRETLPPTL